MVKRSLIFGVLILIGAIGLAIVFTFFQDYSFNGVVYENPQTAPPINLQASNGKQFSLADQKGKVVIVFFGYTSCPDVCPSTLSDMKRVMEILGQQSDEVQMVFITVDPDRDTIERLNGYMNLFSPTFLGLTGTNAELEKVWRDYGVFREVDTSSETAAGYLVNHSSRIYIIDPSGQLFLTYSFGTSPDPISEDVSYILNHQ